MVRLQLDLMIFKVSSNLSNESIIAISTNSFKHKDCSILYKSDGSEKGNKECPFFHFRQFRERKTRETSWSYDGGELDIQKRKKICTFRL